jgi:hypothetical protein
VIEERKGTPLILVDLLLLVALLSIGGCLLVYRPEYELLGGIILSLTQVIVGIILPYHLKRINAVRYRFFPQREQVLSSVVLAVVFTLLLLAAGYRSVFKLMASPPPLLPAI